MGGHKMALTWKVLWCLGSVASAHGSLVCVFDRTARESSHVQYRTCVKRI